MVKNLFSSLGIFLWILNRIVFGRSLCNTCKSRTFGKVQIPYIFIEILTCRSLNSICTGTKVDSVQIVFQYDILIIYFFLNFYGKILFLELTCKTLNLSGLIGPVGKYIIFQKLLGNGTGSL